MSVNLPAHPGQIFLGSGSQSPSSTQEMTSVVLDPVIVGQMMVTFVPTNAGSVYPDTITSEDRFKSGSSHLTVVNKLEVVSLYIYFNTLYQSVAQ